MSYDENQNLVYDILMDNNGGLWRIRCPQFGMGVGNTTFAPSLLAGLESVVRSINEHAYRIDPAKPVIIVQWRCDLNPVFESADTEALKVVPTSSEPVESRDPYGNPIKKYEQEVHRP